MRRPLVPVNGISPRIGARVANDLRQFAVVHVRVPLLVAEFDPALAAHVLDAPHLQQGVVGVDGAVVQAEHVHRNRACC
jgi:hypothetical protein